jgi:NADPH-dependent glutamate synthase beta subunit-like oxidoreductase/ferredoxin
MPPLTDAQLRAEVARCLSCETRPCRAGCPAGCSPGDFILAARCGEPSDYRRAAALILSPNPLGGACGEACPDTLCMARCSRRALDGPVDIPAIQAAIVRQARALGVISPALPAPTSGKRVAVVGAGPAGLGAASVLAKAGHGVDLFDRGDHAGGAARLLPRDRLDPAVLDADVAGLLALGDVQLRLGAPVKLPRALLESGYAAVVVTTGLGEPIALDVPGRERALPWTRLLGDRPPALEQKRVAVIGDGAVAFDCAAAALARGAAHVELFALRRLSELALTASDRERLFASGMHLSCRVRVTAIRGRGRGPTLLALRKVELPAGESFHPSRLVDLPHGEHERRDFDVVVVAIGGRSPLRQERHPRVLYAGDLATGPTTIVEALASGKRAGLDAHKLLAGDDSATCPDRPACPEGGGACPKRATCPEWTPSRPAAGTELRAAPPLPVPLACELGGQSLRSPFLLAAPAFTRGYAQVRRAYEAGWAGAVLAPTLAPGTIQADVERLRREFPDRLTLAAGEAPAGPAGGPADYRQAAAMIERGARAVLVDDLVTRHGLLILDELQSGLSHLLAERGLRSVAELRVAPPAAPPAGLAAVDPSTCCGCGNCSRCPQHAVTLDARGMPTIDPARCDGCALCVGWCFVGALSVRAGGGAARG